MRWLISSSFLLANRKCRQFGEPGLERRDPRFELPDHLAHTRDRMLTTERQIDNIVVVLHLSFLPKASRFLSGIGNLSRGGFSDFGRRANSWRGSRLIP